MTNEDGTFHVGRIPMSYETTIEGDSYDELMEIVKNCQKVAINAGCKAVSAYVKICFKPEGGVLTIDKKVSKHHK